VLSRKHWRRYVIKYAGQFRHPNKLVLHSIYDTSLSSLMMWNLQNYPAATLNGMMTFLGGSKHTLTILHIFSGRQDPQPPGPVPLDNWSLLCFTRQCINTVQEWCDDYVKPQLMKISAKNHLDWRYVRNTQTSSHFLFEHSLLCCGLAQLIQLTDNVKVARSNPMLSFIPKILLWDLWLGGEVVA